MNVIKYEKESVLIKDGKIKAWIDVWIEDEDLQDFTAKSDIDWSKSIEEIDQQLYKKYNLTKI